MNVHTSVRAGASAALFASFVLVGSATAQTTASYGTIDPYDYAPAAPQPSWTTLQNWQMDPFSVGYNLLGGYRGLYIGAAQPIGHETISTHGGNGYVYRPIYGSQPFYGWQHFGSYAVVPNHGSKGTALVVDNPGTPNERRYSPSQGLGRGHAAMITVMPEYYAAAPYAYDYGYSTQASYDEPLVDRAVQLPTGDLRLSDGTIVPAQSPTASELPSPPEMPAKPKKSAAAPKPSPKKLEPKKREF